MELFGVRIDKVSLDEVVVLVGNAIREPRRLPLFIVTPNPEQIVQAQKDKEFRSILNSADLNIPDGWGLVWASVILANQESGIRNKGTKILTERVSGVEVMEAVARLGHKNMFVGGKPGAAEKTANKLGGVGLAEPDVEEINRVRPDCLFVGLGAPKQEKWAHRQLRSLGGQVKVVMVVGGALDQMADPTLKPPRWIDQHGLGWLYRLVRQPSRLGRQLRLVRFGWMVFRQMVSRGI